MALIQTTSLFCSNCLTNLALLRLFEHFDSFRTFSGKKRIDSKNGVECRQLLSVTSRAYADESDNNNFNQFLKLNFFRHFFKIHRTILVKVKKKLWLLTLFSRQNPNILKMVFTQPLRLEYFTFITSMDPQTLHVPLRGLMDPQFRINV